MYTFITKMHVRPSHRLPCNFLLNFINPPQDSMIAAGILPLLITLVVDSPYDTAEMSRKAAKTLSNLTATPESAAAVIKVAFILYI